MTKLVRNKKCNHITNTVISPNIIQIILLFLLIKYYKKLCYVKFYTLHLDNFLKKSKDFFKSDECD